MSDTTSTADSHPPLSPHGRVVSASDLDLAVARGIITAEQRDGLLALRSGGDVDHADVETRSGLNLVTIAYWAGSVAVLFALAWFLIDRWKSLRPGGVLAVALLYAMGFGLSSGLLKRLGYGVAASLLAVLTVGMAPVTAWCILSLLGLWPEPTIRRDLFMADVMESVRWIPLQLSMALAGLVAIRQVRFGLLTLTVVIPMGVAMVQLTPVVLDPELNFRLSGWMTIVASTFMLVAGYIIDQRAPNSDEDYAGWVYLSAAGFLLFGLMQVGDQSPLVRHLLPAVIALLVAFSFTLHRRIFLIPAAIFFVAYLAFLAQDVFPTAVGFMLVMLSVGAVLILGTVVAQRRFPDLIRRLSGEGSPRPASRAFGVTVAALAVLSVILLFVAVPRARAELARLQERRNAAFRQRVEFERSAKAAGAMRARRATETKAGNRP